MINRWKTWGLIGTVLGAGAFTIVCLKGNLSALNELQTFTKVAIGFSESVIAGAISSSISTARYYLARYKKISAQVKQIEESLALEQSTVTFNEVADNSGKGIGSYQLIDSMFLETAESALELHVRKCTQLVNSFLDKNRTPEEKEAYRKMAIKLRQEFSTLSDKQYLDHLTENNYLYDDLPLNIFDAAILDAVSKVSEGSGSINSVQSSTPQSPLESEENGDMWSYNLRP